MSVKSWEIGWVGGVRTASIGRSRQSGFVQLNDTNSGTLRAELSGFEEVPPILTPAEGTFEVRITDDQSALEYELSYANLSAPVTAAHIHFGQPGVNGEVIAFLCGGNGKPSCPEREGTVTGRIVAADIRAIPSQGLAAGDLAGAIRIIQTGNAYANVHTTMFPAGEIRGQIR